MFNRFGAGFVRLSGAFVGLSLACIGFSLAFYEAHVLDVDVVVVVVVVDSDWCRSWRCLAFQPLFFLEGGEGVRG